MNAPGEAYFRWYYDSLVWKRLNYRGVRILKSPADLWNYQEIIQEHRLEWVLETGTRHGGSALYFADLLNARASPGMVISVDIEHDSLQIPKQGVKGLHLLKGDSASPAMVEQIRALLPQRRAGMFVILDSDHAKAHVLRELHAYVSLMREGDYLVVEDTCVNGHPVRNDFGPGPMEAIIEFVGEHPGLLRHDREREDKFGFTCAPKGFYIRL